MKEERTMILFEGNIAAGKSTLGEELARSGKFGFVPEPVDQWQNFRLPSSRKATNLLKLFYKDQERWAFTFQMGPRSPRGSRPGRKSWRATITGWWPSSVPFSATAMSLP